MTAAPEGAPPGWYPDPAGSGMQRWWNGVDWSDQVAGAGLPASLPASGTDARQWAIIAHLSALIGLITGLSFLGPLVVYLVKRDAHPYIRDQAAEALNFNLSFLIYAVVLGFFTFVLLLLIVGILLIPVLIALVVGWLVLVIVAAVRAGRGESYRYPLTIRFVR